VAQIDAVISQSKHEDVSEIDENSFIRDPIKVIPDRIFPDDQTAVS
jgi:hypothetical protein